MFRQFKNENNSANHGTDYGRLPPEIRAYIHSFTARHDKKVCRNVCTMFYRDVDLSLATDPTFWIQPLIDLGYDEKLIRETLALGIIKNCSNLYRVLSHLPDRFHDDIKKIWQLLCVSGEPTAISLGIKHGHITEKEMDPDADNILSYAALSGLPAQLDEAMKLKISFGDPFNHAYSLFHFATLSGHRVQIEKIFQLEKNYKGEIGHIAKRGKHVLHIAVLSNFPEQVDAVMELFKVTLLSVKDNEGCTPADYVNNGTVINPKMKEKVQSILALEAQDVRIQPNI